MYESSTDNLFLWAHSSQIFKFHCNVSECDINVNDEILLNRDGPTQYESRQSSCNSYLHILKWLIGLFRFKTWPRIIEKALTSHTAVTCCVYNYRLINVKHYWPIRANIVWPDGVEQKISALMQTFFFFFFCYNFINCA